MNKTLKKVLIFLLSFIVVVVVVIMAKILLTENRTSQTAPSAPPAIETPPAQTAPPSPSETVPPPSASEPAVSEPPSEGKAVVKREETPNGALYTVTVPEGPLTFMLTVDETIFKTEGYGDDGMLVRAIKDQNAYVRVKFIKDAKSDDLAPSFLNPMITYKEFEQSGDNYITGTKISGETVTANDGAREMTAWLVDTDGGVLSVAVSLSMSDKAVQTAWLNKVLASLTIEE